jgi:hypothetical protein
MLDASTLQRIAAQVRRQFPEMAQSQPRVRPQAASKSAGAAQTQTYVLSFECQANTPNGKILPRCVRVVADAEGKIIKMTTTR